MNEQSIELNNISKSFGLVDAVKQLSLTVKKGEIFGFLGPNGAGKSTTIRMITGILQPDGGSIVINGVSLAKDPVAVKQGIGYVPDDPYIYRYLTGREFLTFVGTVFGVSHKAQTEHITHLRQIFPTMDNIDAPFYTYSRGTRQKLVFMAAMMHQPDLYVIDEPMVGLDPESAKVIKDILRRESKRGATIFMSTHTLSVAQELCDRVAIINRGKLVVEGTVAELRHLTKHSEADLEELFLDLT